MQSDIISAVIIKKDVTHTRKKIWFSPAALKLYDQNAILNIFEKIVFCSTTKPGKRILGWTHPKDCSKFQTVNWTQEYIDSVIQLIDENSASNATSRANGIVFNRLGYSDPDTADIFSSKKRRKRQYSTSRQNPILHMKDLDVWSAQQQHMRCPDPFKEPVRTPEYVMRAYKQKDMGHGSIKNYPESIIERREKIRERHWLANSAKGFKKDVGPLQMELRKKYKK